MEKKAIRVAYGEAIVKLGAENDKVVVLDADLAAATMTNGFKKAYPDRFIDLAEFSEIPPMVNQVETHVFNQQIEAQQIMEQYGTHIMAWGPFAEGRNNFFGNETLIAVGAKYNKSAAQTALRYLIQRGVIVIPKSVRKERMEQNLDVFDFTLTDEDMQRIRQLDLGHSLFFSHYDPQTVKWLCDYGKSK